MRVYFDKAADAIHFRLDDSAVIDSEEVKPGLVVDYNAESEIVGVEILNVGKRVAEVNLKQIQFEIA